MAENRDRLVTDVAKKLSLNHKAVKEAIRIQHQMLKVTMQFDEQKTFYLRKVGYFQHTDLRKKLLLEKIERAKQNKSNNEDIQDPYEFN